MKNTRATKKISFLFLITYLTFVLPACHKMSPVGTPPPPASTRWARLASPADTITVLYRFDNAICAASNNNTLYKSLDQGASWSSVKVGTPDETITAITFFNTELYVGTNDSRIFVSDDGGRTWDNGKNLSNSSIEGSVAISSFAERNGILYASTDGNGVFVLNNETNSWLPFDNNLPISITSYFVYELLNSQDTLLASAGVNSTFYRYDFNANQWVSSQLPSPQSHIISMIDDNGTVYGLTDEQLILRSDNKGRSWKEDDNGHQRWLPATSSQSPFLYAGTTRVYAVTDTHSNGAFSTWVQERNKEAVFGTTWSQQQDFLQGIRAHALVEAGGTLFLGTDTGIYTRKIDK